MTVGFSLGVVARAVIGVRHGIIIIENVDVVIQLVVPAASILPTILALSYNEKIKGRYGQ